MSLFTVAFLPEVSRWNESAACTRRAVYDMARFSYNPVVTPRSRDYAAASNRCVLAAGMPRPRSAGKPPAKTLV